MKQKYSLTVEFSGAYFGPILFAYQCDRNRIPFMEMALKEEMKRVEGDFKLLEIGCWAGQSTSIWGKIFKKAKRGKIYCVDNWLGAKNIPNMCGQREEIIKLFNHNISVLELDDYVVRLQGNSDDVLPQLRDESFNLIYVDGDHAYSQFRRDLENSCRLVKDNGVVAGDDCDQHISKINTDFAREHAEEDTIVENEYTGKGYHPGVILGVFDVFGNNVSSFRGFWCVRKWGKEWRPAYQLAVGEKK